MTAFSTLRSVEQAGTFYCFTWGRVYWWKVRDGRLLPALNIQCLK
jgi:hypothetical protein